MRTGTELQRGVIEALAWEPSIDAAGIGVSAESGIVMLTARQKACRKNGRPYALRSALRE